MPSPQPASSASLPLSERQSSLADVDIKAQLSQRSSRPPDYEAERLALLQLAEAMAEHPSEVLQKLIDITCEVCRADTAGLSLLETRMATKYFAGKP